MTDKVVEEARAITQNYHAVFMDMMNLWSSHIVFTWRWWFELIVVTLLPVVVWLIFRKKEQTHRLMYAGMFVLIAASFLDMAGLCLGLWFYPYRLVPFIPQYISWDFSAFPVSVMLSYQYFPKMKKWLKGLIHAGFSSFLIQPAAVWLKLYDPVQWKSWYSFPIIFLIFMAGYWFYEKGGSSHFSGNR